MDSDQPSTVDPFHGAQIQPFCMPNVSLPFRFPAETWQFVSNVVGYSSSYNAGWEASCLIGSPRVYPSYGDIRGAWAPARSSGTEEWLELEFETPVHITGVDIFETYHPGQVVAIRAHNNGELVTLFEEAWTPKNLQGESRVFSVPLNAPFTVFKTNLLRIELDCRQARSWSEIDSVVLRGLKNIQWKPEDHHLYPASFRAMVKTLLLINQQHKGMWLPQAIIYEIFSWAALDWPCEPPPNEAKASEEPEIGTLAGLFNKMLSSFGSSNSS